MSVSSKPTRPQLYRATLAEETHHLRHQLCKPSGGGFIYIGGATRRTFRSLARRKARLSAKLQRIPDSGKIANG
jgi:hypothetical protein